MQPDTQIARAAFLRRSGAGLAALGVPSVVQAATAPVSVTIINTGASDVLTLQALVEQRKYLASLGVNATTQNVSDGIKVLDGLVGGGADIGILTGFSQIFPAIEHGAKVKLVAGAMLPPEYVIYTANPAIKTLKDLEGKSVGTGAIGALLYAVVVAMLRKENVDVSKINFVNIGSSISVFKAVAAKKVDAGPGEPQFERIASRYGVRVLADAVKVIPQFTMQGSFTTDRTIATKRDALVRTLAAYQRAYQFVNGPNSEPAYIAAYREAMPGPAATATGEASFMWRWIQSNHAYDQALVLSPERVMYMQQLNVSLGSQKAVLPYDRVTDMSIARDALKLAASIKL